MIAKCPHCGTQYEMKDEILAGRAEMQGRCRVCHKTFALPFKTASKSVAESSEEATRLAAPGDFLHLPQDKIVALSVTAGPQKGEVFVLSKPRVLVGRKGADVVLNDPQVSRQHCVIEITGAAARVMDLDTTNGTAVNGVKITRSCELEHLSEVRIGASCLLYTVRAKD